MSEGYVATIGMFDGVHRGHRFVIDQLKSGASELGLQSMVVTFDHTLRCGEILTPLDEKLLLLSQTGVERVEVLPFTDALRRMTAREFMERVLRRQLDVRALLIGYDNRFGHNREEGYADYVRYGQELGVEVRQLPPLGMENGLSQVSSSAIRQMLAAGHVREVADMLSYPYTILGHVEHGEHIGTRLGFPTANLALSEPRQLIPAPGVYAVKVRIGHSDVLSHGMMNIGCRPTFDGGRQTLEVHIFQFHANLYGQRLMVSFVDRLRDERRFADEEALKSQLAADREAAEAILGKEEKVKK